MKTYRYFDRIDHGPLFDPETPDEIGPDSRATHAYRDMSMIKIIRQWGEVLKGGLAEPRDVGEYLMNLADEAEELEREVGFGYERDTRHDVAI